MFHNNHIPYISGGDKCPECGYPQKCGCPSCVDRIGEYKVFTWSEDGNSHICPDCGFIEDGNYWMLWELACWDLTRVKNE